MSHLPLTRTEVNDAQKRMRRGVRFSVTWRFGANDDYEESGLVVLPRSGLGTC